MPDPALPAAPPAAVDRADRDRFRSAVAALPSGPLRDVLTAVAYARDAAARTGAGAAPDDRWRAVVAVAERAVAPVLEPAAAQTTGHAVAPVAERAVLTAEAAARASQSAPAFAAVRGRGRRAPVVARAARGTKKAAAPHRTPHEAAVRSAGTPAAPTPAGGTGRRRRPT
jgi:hypothetical protein